MPLPDAAEVERTHARKILRDGRLAVGDFRWEMLTLVYADGFTQRQIAERVCLPIGVVRAEIARGLRAVAALVEEPLPLTPASSRGADMKRWRPQA